VRASITGAFPGEGGKVIGRILPVPEEKPVLKLSAHNYVGSNITRHDI
jgi:hypothetical protein